MGHPGEAGVVDERLIQHPSQEDCQHLWRTQTGLKPVRERSPIWSRAGVGFLDNYASSVIVLDKTKLINAASSNHGHVATLLPSTPAHHARRIACGAQCSL